MKVWIVYDAFNDEVEKIFSTAKLAKEYIKSQIDDWASSNTLEEGEYEDALEEFGYYNDNLTNYFASEGLAYCRAEEVCDKL
jgi:hypothetical protein